jgi:hypothetical protein
MLGTHGAAGEETDRAVAIVRPYTESGMSEEARVRCPTPGQLFEIVYIDDAPQQYVVDAYFPGTGERTIRVRRGQVVEDTEIPTDVDPLNAKLQKLQYRLEVKMLVCANAFSMILVEGRLQLEGKAEGLRLGDAWSLDDISDVSVPFTLNYISNLLRSEPNLDTDELPSLMHRTGSSLRFELMQLPITLYAEPSGDTLLTGQVVIRLPSIPVVRPDER